MDHHRQPHQRAQPTPNSRSASRCCPPHKRRGSPTGGGNFYISKKASAAEQAAAFQFIKWITTPERAAQWSIDTGYVAVRPDAYETDAMKKYVADFPPAAVARDQLKFAVAELSTHENQRVTKALNDGLQAALTGTKTAEQAMKDAQAEAERILQAVSVSDVRTDTRRSSPPPLAGEVGARSGVARGTPRKHASGSRSRAPRLAQRPPPQAGRETELAAPLRAP